MAEALASLAPWLILGALVAGTVTYAIMTSGHTARSQEREANAEARAEYLREFERRRKRAKDADALRARVRRRRDGV